MILDTSAIELAEVNNNALDDYTISNWCGPWTCCIQKGYLSKQNKDHTHAVFTDKIMAVLNNCLMSDLENYKQFGEMNLKSNEEKTRYGDSGKFHLLLKFIEI